MSYILDALRRADSERSRGVVPGVHDQPLPAPGGEAAVRPARGVPLVWAVIAGLLVLVGVLGWQLMRQAPAVRVATVPPPLPPVPPMPVTPAPPAVAPVPARVAPEPAPDTAPEPAPAKARQAREAREDTPPGPRRPAKREVAKAATPAAALAPTPPVVALADLPPQVRSELPKLDVGGSVYSQNPASRYLILNGQVFREQAMVTKDLRLEEIHLRSAVFGFKGYRYRVEY